VEACGVPAGADAVSGPPGDARIRRKLTLGTRANAPGVQNAEPLRHKRRGVCERRLCTLRSIVPLALVRFGVVIVVIHATTLFGCRFEIVVLTDCYHVRKMTIRTTDIRGKVGVVTYPLYLAPWLLSEVNKLDNLRKRDNAAVLSQPLIHEIQLLFDFDDR
jgi:hypothetical protein